jgi:hypothetical protein
MGGGGWYVGVKGLSGLGYIIGRTRLRRIGGGMCVATGSSWLTSVVGRVVGGVRCLGCRGIDVDVGGVFIDVGRFLSMCGLSGRCIVGVVLVELSRCTGSGLDIV